MPAPYSQDLRDRVASRYPVVHRLGAPPSGSGSASAPRFGGRSVCVPKDMPGLGPWAVIVARG